MCLVRAYQPPRSTRPYPAVWVTGGSRPRKSESTRGPMKRPPTWPPQHRIAEVLRRAQRRRQDLGGGVGVGGIERQARPQAGVELAFGAVGQRFVHVHVLADDADGIAGEFNLAAKNVVEISGREHESAAHQPLLNARIKGAVL